VVEDIPLNQLMKILLDDFGFERDIAENGKIAVEKSNFTMYLIEASATKNAQPMLPPT
jgi:hypothetical protein